MKFDRCSGLKVAKKREMSDSKLIFLAAIGYVVGLGNVW
jgi:SNF family Na+-dependent transporter